MTTKEKKAFKAINLKNPHCVQLLETALSDVQKLSRTRTIDAEDILNALNAQTLFLNGINGIPKKALDGVCVSIDPNAQHFPAAYRFVPESTQFRAVYKNGSWRVTAIFRGTCTTLKTRVYLTDDAKAALIKNAEFQTI